MTKTKFHIVMTLIVTIFAMCGSPLAAAPVCVTGCDEPPVIDPVVEIGPEQTVVVSGRNERYQFEASIKWPCQDAPRAGKSFAGGGTGSGDCSGPTADSDYDIVWMSSDPDQVAVDQNGLATALTDSAYANIMAYLSWQGTAYKHEPAVASMMVGAFADDLTRLPRQLVVGADAELSSSSQTIELEVISNPQTQALQAGDHVLFGDAWTIAIEHVEQSLGRRLLRGTPLPLNDIFEQLTVDISGDSATAFHHLYNDLSPSTASSRQTHLKDLDCGYDFIIDFPAPQTELHLKIENRQLALISLGLQGGFSAAGMSQKFTAEMVCTFEIPDFPVLPFTIAAFPAISFWLDAGWAVEGKVYLEIGGGAEGAEMPEFTYQQDYVSNVSYTPEGGAETSGSVSDPTLDIEPNLIATDDPGSGLSVKVGGSASFLIGPKWRLFIGPPTPRFSSLNLGDLWGPVMDLTYGRETTIPAEAFLTTYSADYQGPIIEDKATIGMTLIKSLGADGDSVITSILRYLGSDAEVHLEVGKYIVDEGVWPMPQPQELEFSEQTVYVGGDESAGQPPCTDFMFWLTPWTNPIYDIGPVEDCKIIMWREEESPVSGYLAAEGRSGSICPHPDEVGNWVFRGQCYLNVDGLSSLFPVVTPKKTLTVLPGADLTTDPLVFYKIQSLDSAQTWQLDIINHGETSATFTLDDGGASWVDVLTPGGTVGAGESIPIELRFTCDDAVGTYTTPLEILSDASTHPGELWLSCTAFMISPEKLVLEAEVGDTWSAYFNIANPGAQPLGYSVAASGVDVSPAQGDIAALGASEAIEVSSTCNATGSTTYTLGVTGTVEGGATETKDLQVEVTCTDEGGRSTGDPHLISFDDVAFDFQAPGEMVLARDPAGGFEIQTRQVPWIAGAALNQAVAIDVAGDRVAFYVEPPSAGGEVMVGGQALDLESELPVAAAYDLPHGGSIERLEDRFYVVRWPSGGARVDLRLVGSFAKAVNLFVRPPEGASLVGVLGNHDGDPSNDFRLRNGALLPGSPPSHADLHDCSAGRACFAYGEHGWWITDAGESLFDYEPGMGPLNYAPQPGSPPVVEVTLADFPPAHVELARERCLEGGVPETDEVSLTGCMLDYLLTGDLELATAVADFAEPSQVDLRLTAQPPVAGAEFGRAVARDGDLVGVGAPAENGGAGAVYLLQRNHGGSNNWGQVARLTAADGAADDLFGGAVAISGDFLAVGARNADDVFANLGAVYIFERDVPAAGQWGQVAKLMPASPNDDGGRFGHSVAIDGDTLVVGEVWDNQNGPHAGKVHVFERDPAAGWSLLETLLCPGTSDDDECGHQVAIDGDTLVVTAPGWGLRGAGYVFERQAGTFVYGTYRQGSTWEWLGGSLALDGDFMALGAPGWDVDGGPQNAGRVHIYGRNHGGAGSWGEIGIFTASVPSPNSWFGNALAFEGETLAVGTPGEQVGGVAGAGSVYRLVYDPVAQTWTETERLTAAAGAAGDGFGDSVAAGDDDLLIGAPHSDDACSSDPSCDSGAVHLVHR